MHISYNVSISTTTVSQLGTVIFLEQHVGQEGILQLFVVRFLIQQKRSKDHENARQPWSRRGVAQCPIVRDERWTRVPLEGIRGQACFEDKEGGVGASVCTRLPSPSAPRNSLSGPRTGQTFLTPDTTTSRLFSLVMLKRTAFRGQVTQVVVRNPLHWYLAAEAWNQTDAAFHAASFRTYGSCLSGPGFTELHLIPCPKPSRISVF